MAQPKEEFETYDDFVMPRNLDDKKSEQMYFDEFDSCDSCDKCDRCELNSECELMDEYRLLMKNNPDADFPEYINEDRKNCLLTADFNTAPYGDNWVADGIGNHHEINIIDIIDYYEISNYQNEEEIRRWGPTHPVVISAQTGSGKNHFIEETLIPYVRDLTHKQGTTHKVLLISNRRALKKQIEHRLKNGTDKDPLYYPYGECADVIMYQSILKASNILRKKQKKKNSKYIFVVCDEAHFFASDSGFNYDTEKILTEITVTFKDAIRIYMTATPYDVLRYIADSESNSVSQPEMGIGYHFKRNYDYLDVKYYSDIKELKDIIVHSVNKQKEKWLIFIDDKDKCKDVKDILAETNDNAQLIAEDSGDLDETETEDKADKNKKTISFKDKILTIDATSKGDPQYDEMILNEKFDNHIKVVIATSVIDNGINFKKDKKLKNVVLSDISKTKCLQMLGRIRVGDDTDRITLYIKRFNEKYIQDRITDLKRKQDAYHDYDVTFVNKIKTGVTFLNKYFKGNSVDMEIGKYLFGFQEERFGIPPIYYNNIARKLIDQLIPKYESILDEMWRTDTGTEVTGQKYLEYQLSWFGKEYDIENDITLADKGKNENALIDFLESWVDKQILKSMQDEFRNKFTDLSKQAFGEREKNKRSFYSKDTINKVLEKQDLRYKVESITTNKETYWVVRINGESDNLGSE